MRNILFFLFFAFWTEKGYQLIHSTFIFKIQLKSHYYFERSSKKWILHYEVSQNQILKYKEIALCKKTLCNILIRKRKKDYEYWKYGLTSNYFPKIKKKNDYTIKFHSALMSEYKPLTNSYVIPMILENESSFWTWFLSNIYKLQWGILVSKN